MSNNDDQTYWFEYAIMAGRFTATPVHPLGWLTLFACIALTLGIATMVVPPLFRVNTILGFAGLTGILLTSVYSLCRFAVAKGRRIY